MNLTDQEKKELEFISVLAIKIIIMAIAFAGMAILIFSF